MLKASGVRVAVLWHHVCKTCGLAGNTCDSGGEQSAQLLVGEVERQVRNTCDNESKPINTDDHAADSSEQQSRLERWSLELVKGDTLRYPQPCTRDPEP